MRATLRRSCNACAKAKHGCDLRTPRCSRCIKRNCPCVYANEPLTSSSKADTLPPERQRDSRAGSRRGSPSRPESDGSVSPVSPGALVALSGPAGSSSLDPFNSHPPTRIPKAQVHRLMHHFLSSIAFQYYPQDLNRDSNPFIVNWWPLALADPALFHVSLQTASLDEELRAQRGFPISDLLMHDSVSLVRRRVQDPLKAFEDTTLDAVVTLAAIEHGKGNVEASRMHIDGVKRMVAVRGGIDEVRRANPLTAGMVSWVSLFVTGTPQFGIKDDSGVGSGIGPIPQWQQASAHSDGAHWAENLDLDPAMSNVLSRLRSVFHQPQNAVLSNTEVHELACFVLHKLLLLPPLSPEDPKRATLSESLRYATALYMLILHGTTYYSPLPLVHVIMHQFMGHLKVLAEGEYMHKPIGVWVFTIAMSAPHCFPSQVVTPASADQQWFTTQARVTAETLGFRSWEDIVRYLDNILWIKTPQEIVFRQKWEAALNGSDSVG